MILMIMIGHMSVGKILNQTYKTMETYTQRKGTKN